MLAEPTQMLIICGLRGRWFLYVWSVWFGFPKDMVCSWRNPKFQPLITQVVIVPQAVAQLLQLFFNFFNRRKTASQFLRQYFRNWILIFYQRILYYCFIFNMLPRAKLQKYIFAISLLGAYWKWNSNRVFSDRISKSNCESIAGGTVKQSSVYWRNWKRVGVIVPQPVAQLQPVWSMAGI